jgi:RNA polymerase sigma factor (sigma-70 family)
MGHTVREREGKDGVTEESEPANGGNRSAANVGIDTALLQACRAGDQQAWSVLVERYGRMVYAIPRRIGLSQDDADDVFQAVFASLLRSLDSIADPASLPYWLMTTTRRESWRIGRQRGSFIDLDEATADDRATVGVELEQYERDLLVRDAMARLDPRCRQLLTALFLEPDEQSYTRISEEMGMPVGSIGPTRARCLRKVQKILASLGVDGLA